MPGKGIGHKIGYATANLQLQNQALPPFGVYAVEVELEETSKCIGVMNYGSRPTVSDEPARFEVHLFDFSGDLYGQNIKVDVRSKIRDEKKFETLQKCQIF